MMKKLWEEDTVSTSTQIFFNIIGLQYLDILDSILRNVN